MILTPGALHGPWVVPYCRRCQMPVEVYTIHEITSHDRLELEGKCCGVQQGVRVGLEELMRIRRNGEKLWMITRPGERQTVDKHPGFGRRWKKHSVAAPVKAETP